MIAAEKEQLWLTDHIWPEIHAMMHNDAYFRLWLPAQELARKPYGPIAQTMINGYATYQLAAIRRMCDGRADSISLLKLLNLISKEQPQQKIIVTALSDRLKTECEELSGLASQYVAHHGNPARRDGRDWSSSSSDQMRKAQNAICTTAIVIERDLLRITQRTNIIPVPQFDSLAEVRELVPEDKLALLREFWDEHNKEVNGWANVPKFFAGPRAAHPPRAGS
jgi:hypothetical protein